MIPTMVQLCEFPPTSLTKLARRQRHNPKAVVLDSASLESFEKETNLPVRPVPAPKYYGLEMKLSKAIQHIHFWASRKHKKTAITERKRQTFQGNDTIKCAKADVGTLLKVDFKSFRWFVKYFNRNERSQFRGKCIKILLHWEYWSLHIC